MTVAREFRGLWRREVLVTPDGLRDTTTRVFWLQTDLLYADLRAPADRPDALPGQDGPRGFSDASLVGLARMQGFAGTFEVEGTYCRWNRELDFQPPSGEVDEANYVWEGGLLIEHGISAPYREDWRRLTAPDAPTAAFRRADGTGILVAAGDYFLAVEDHRGQPLEAAPSLAALVEAALGAGDRDAACRYLDLRIDFGRTAREGAGWPITLSTRPWTEGGHFLPDKGWNLAGADLDEAALAEWLPELFRD